MLKPIMANQTLRVGFIDYSGFIEEISPGEYEGYAVEYLEEIAQYTNWNYEFVLDSWDNCLEKLKSGEIDLLCNAQYTPERALVYDFSQYSIGEEYTIVYSREDADIYYQDFEAMQNCTIGFLKGSYQNQLWDQYAKEHHIQFKSQIYETETASLDALYNKDVDLIVSGGLALHKDVKVIDKFNAKPFYFISQKNKKNIMQPLNKALEQIFNKNPYFNAYLYEEYYHTSAYSTQPLFTREEVTYIKQLPSLKVGMEKEDTPFVYQRKDKYIGILPDLLKDIERKSGLKFDVQYGHYRDQIDTFFSQNHFDKNALFYGVRKNHLSFNEKSQYLLSRSFLNVDQVLVTKNNANIQNALTIALTYKQKELENDLVQKYPQAKMIYYSTIDECLETIDSGHVDMTINNAFSMNYLIQKFGYSHDLSTYNISLKPVEFCFAGGNQIDPLLISILDKTTDSFSQKDIETIIQDYTIGLKYEYTFSEYMYQHRNIIMFLGLVVCIIIIIIYLLAKRHTEFLLQKKETEILRHKAERDSLTNIYNQETFYEKAKQYLKIYNKEFYMLYINVNRFKTINDLYGIDEGNRLLTYIGSQLKAYMDQCSQILCCHLQGDQFLVLIPKQEYLLHKELNLLEGYRSDVNISLRYGLYQIDDRSVPIHLMADRAALASKSVYNNYLNQVGVYSEEQRQMILHEQMIMNHIQDAIDNDEIIIYIQPKYNIMNNQIVGGEALVRWQHPQEGMISPSEFLPVLEKNGYIIQLDYYIWDKTCQLLKSMKEQYDFIMPISINLSRLNFYRPHLPQLLLELVKKYQLQPQDLQLEITESVYTKDTDLIYSVIRELQEFKFTVLMDDFGSGYSSLNMLKDAPVDIIKLDMQFLSSKDSLERSHAIIQAIVELSHSLNILVIVEGVETKEQVEFLSSIHVKYVQGYYFSKPITEKEYIQLCYIKNT